MKYLKLFESIWQRKEEIWKVPTRSEEEFIVSLDKIGMPEKEIDRWIDLGIIKLSKSDHILVFSNHIVDDDWAWSNINATDVTGKKYIDSKEYQYEIEVTPEDIEMYYLKKSANKYNI
jgi:hypothetical protein